LGVDVLHVPAMHLRLPDENQYSSVGFQRARPVAQGRAPQGHPWVVRHGFAQRQLQRHGYLAGRLPVRGRGRAGRVPGEPAGICRNGGAHRQTGGRVLP